MAFGLTAVANRLVATWPSARITGYPFTLACAIDRTTTGVTKALFSVWTAAGGADSGIWIGVDSAQRITGQIRNAGVTGAAAIAPGVNSGTLTTVGSWNTFAYTASATGKKRMYRYGGGYTTQGGGTTVSATVTISAGAPFTRVIIGGIGGAGTGSTSLSGCGCMAHVAVWKTDLSETECRSLHYFSPRYVRPESLVFYAACEGNPTYHTFDYYSGAALTAVTTQPTWANYSPSVVPYPNVYQMGYKHYVAQPITESPTGYPDTSSFGVMSPFICPQGF